MLGNKQTVWRSQCPEVVRQRQERVLNGRRTNLLLLRQNGPAAFTIGHQGQGDIRAHHVLLSDPHSCTCVQFRREKELCIHLCWTLLKKLKLDIDDCRSFQLGLGSSELESLLQRQNECGDSESQRRSSPGPSTSRENSGEIHRRPVSPSDACPICLEKLLEKHAPVTSCKHGCGRNVHISCMKILAEHQIRGVTNRSAAFITCPLCRGNFGSMSDLLLEARNAPRMYTVGGGSRLGVDQRLRLPPIVDPSRRQAECSGCGSRCAEVFRCLRCPQQQLCASCLYGSDPLLSAHRRHGLAIRKQGSKFAWVPITEEELDRKLALEGIFLQNRWSEETVSDTKTLPEELLQELPLLRVREGHRLLFRGQQCCLCLTPYLVRQSVRGLPCGHQFHSRCLTRWLLDTSATCPIDGSPVRHALLRKALQRQYSVQLETLDGSKRQQLSRQASRSSDPMGSGNGQAVRGRQKVAAGPSLPPEVTVRKLSVAAERSWRRHCSKNATPRNQIFPVNGSNRAYSLPPRPLGGSRRLQSGGSPSPAPNPDRPRLNVLIQFNPPESHLDSSTGRCHHLEPRVVLSGVRVPSRGCSSSSRSSSVSSANSEVPEEPNLEINTSSSGNGSSTDLLLRCSRIQLTPRRPSPRRK